jgi:hypothetical protein
MFLLQEMGSLSNMTPDVSSWLDRYEEQKLEQLKKDNLVQYLHHYLLLTLKFIDPCLTPFHRYSYHGNELHSHPILYTLLTVHT